MKLSFAELQETHPELAAKAFVLGTLSGDVLTIRLADWLRLNQGPAEYRSEEEVARIKDICAGCEFWLPEWRCGHVNCKPCQQRVAGGLIELILQTRSRCPAAPRRW